MGWCRARGQYGRLAPSRSGGRMILNPVLGHVHPAAGPDSVLREQVVEEPGQRGGATPPAASRQCKPTEIRRSERHVLARWVLARSPAQEKFELAVQASIQEQLQSRDVLRFGIVPVEVYTMIRDLIPLQAITITVKARI